MTPAIALLVIGGILLKAGWVNQNIIDVALGRDTKRDGGSVDGGGVASSPAVVQGTGGGIGAGVGATLANAAHGTIQFDGHPVAAWIVPILRYARRKGWKGSVNSGYRSFAEQTRIYNSGVRPAAKPGTSNHEGAIYPRGAVDVSEAAQLSAILRSSQYKNILVWAGSKDPPHFSHPHGGSY